MSVTFTRSLLPGLLCDSSLCRAPQKQRLFKEPPRVKLNFSMADHLYLNLTTKYFKMSFETPGECRGKGLCLSIHNPTRMYENLVTPYCGILSQYFTLIDHPHITVVISSTHKLEASLVFSVYSATDNRTVRSYTVIEKKLHVYPQMHIVMFLKPKYVMSYYIRVHPDAVVILLLKEDYFTDIKASDGPSPTGRTVVVHKYQLTLMSSFQCLVHTLSEKYVNLMDLVLLRFYGMPVPPWAIGTTIVNTTTSVKLSTGSHCQKSPCIWRIRTESSRQINASLSLSRFEGSSDQLCIFGGITFGERFKKSFSEYHTFCENYNRSFSGRSVLSQNSSLVLVNYWYPNMSDISVILQISTTKCSTVKISLPKLQCICRPVHARANTMQCWEYLYERRKFSQVLLLDEKRENSKNITLGFDTPSHTCFTLQTTNNKPLCQEVRKPYILFLVPLVLGSHSQINYQIFAGMKPLVPNLLSESADEALDHQSKFLMTSMAQGILTFRGKAERVCTTVLTRNISNCEKSVGASQVSFRMAQDMFLEQRLFSTVVLRTPIRENPFRIELRLFSVLDSWLDVVIHSVQLPFENEKPHQLVGKKSVLIPVESLGSEEAYTVIEQQVEPQTDDSCPAKLIMWSSVVSDLMHIIMHINFVSVMIFFPQMPNQSLSLPGGATFFEIQGQAGAKCSLKIHQRKIKHHKRMAKIILTEQNNCTQRGNKFRCAHWTHDSLVKTKYSLLWQKCMPSNCHLQKYSWVQAFLFCNKSNTNLPSFTSKPQLQKLLGLLKLSEAPVPLEGLFIALTFSPGNQVRE